MRQAHSSEGPSGLTAMSDRPALKSGLIKDLPIELGKSIERHRAKSAGCHFNVYRADQVRLTATQFSGGDWRWQLLDKAGKILVEAGGYPSEDKCREAVTALQRYGAPATFTPTIPFAVPLRDVRL